MRTAKIGPDLRFPKGCVLRTESDFSKSYDRTSHSLAIRDAIGYFRIFQNPQSQTLSEDPQATMKRGRHARYNNKASDSGSP